MGSPSRATIASHCGLRRTGECVMSHSPQWAVPSSLPITYRASPARPPSAW